MSRLGKAGFIGGFTTITNRLRQLSMFDCFRPFLSLLTKLASSEPQVFVPENIKGTISSELLVVASMKS